MKENLRLQKMIAIQWYRELKYLEIEIVTHNIQYSYSV